MQNEDESKKKLVTIGAAVLGAAAGVPFAASPLTSAAATAVATATFDMAGNAFASYHETRAREWWTAFVGSLGTMTAEGAITEAALRSQVDSRFQRLVYHALSAVWNAVDDAVIPALAYLAADYQARGEPPDASYKRLARFVQETSSEELEMMRTLIAEIQAELVAARMETVPHDLHARTDGVTAVAKRDGTAVTVGRKRQVTLGRGCAVLIQRLERDQLIDGFNAIGDYASGFVTDAQADLLQRYFVRPLV